MMMNRNEMKRRLTTTMGRAPHRFALQFTIHLVKHKQTDTHKIFFLFFFSLSVDSVIYFFFFNFSSNIFFFVVRCYIFFFLYFFTSTFPSWLFAAFCNIQRKSVANFSILWFFLSSFHSFTNRSHQKLITIMIDMIWM